MTTSRIRSRAFASLLLLPLAFFLLIPQSADAGTAARKVGRGLAAMTTGFLEVPGNIVRVTRERGAVWGLSLGFAIGLAKLVPRHFVGVYEFLTAPFAVPAEFPPILQPEFPWGYFGGGAPAPRVGATSPSFASAAFPPV